MIEEDYVSFETAKLLKEKGFDEKVDTLYKTDAEFLKSTLCINYNDANFTLSDMHNIPENTVSAPTIQMAMKWLRKKKVVIIPVPYSFTLDNEVYQWLYSIWCGDNLEIDADFEDDLFDSYEDACEDAMKYALENFI